MANRTGLLPPVPSLVPIPAQQIDEPDQEPDGSRPLDPDSPLVSLTDATMQPAEKRPRIEEAQQEEDDPDAFHLALPEDVPEGQLYPRDPTPPGSPEPQPLSPPEPEPSHYSQAIRDRLGHLDLAIPRNSSTRRHLQYDAFMAAVLMSIVRADQPK
jgi:hypothetical protein